MSPSSAALGRAALANVQRTHGVAPRQKAAITTDEMRAMVGTLDPPTPLGARGCAILLVGYATGMRRSELAALSAAMRIRKVRRQRGTYAENGSMSSATTRRGVDNLLADRLPRCRPIMPPLHIPASAAGPQVPPVPFAEKDEAKRLGARWDPKRRLWWVPITSDPVAYARWRSSAP